MNNWAEAEAVVREALTIQEAKEPDAWRPFNTKALLGGALLGQKKYAEAEPLLKAGYAGMKQRAEKIPPINDVILGEALDWLIELAEATGKAEDAKYVGDREGKAAQCLDFEAGPGEEMSEPLPDGGFFASVYDELRRLAAAKLAHEPAGHTLDATALVHEAYLRLGGGASSDRSGFLRSAAVAMQRILVDHARRKRAAKRGGYARKFALQEGDRVTVADPDTILDIDAALTRLFGENPSSAEVARLRLFAGLSIDEAAVALGLSRATAFREWAYARSWLTTALAARTESGSGPIGDGKESF